MSAMRQKRPKWCNAANDAKCHKRTHAPQQSRRDSTGQFCHWATRLKRLVAGTHQTRLVWLCSASDAHVDSAAERAEIDRLSQKCLSAALQEPETGYRALRFVPSCQA